MLENIIQNGAIDVDKYIQQHPEIDKSKLPQKNPPQNNSTNSTSIFN